MDVLSDVMKAVRLTGAVFFDVRASRPVAAQSPSMKLVGHRLMPEAGQVIPFHIMLRGECWIEAIDSNEAAVQFHEGDIVFYPHGHSHIFVTNPGDRQPPQLEQYHSYSGRTLPVTLKFDRDRPADMRFVCGYLACDTAPFNPLLEALPNQVLAPRPHEGSPIEVDLILAAVSEMQENRAGSEAVLARLSELLFVRVLRRYIEQLPEHSRGWLAGLRDPNIGRALQLVHADPGRDWTLEALAREAGMSRAICADRFLKCVGETPMRYLAKWRMQLASRMLEQPGISLEEVAERIGYRSEAAFSRAFKSITGTSPGSWRRTRSASAEHLPAPKQDQDTAA